MMFILAQVVDFRGALNCDQHSHWQISTEHLSLFLVGKFLSVNKPQGKSSSASSTSVCKSRYRLEVKTTNHLSTINTDG